LEIISFLAKNGFGRVEESNAAASPSKNRQTPDAEDKQQALQKLEKKHGFKKTIHLDRQK
jgi:hypothetical protein